MSDAPSVYNLAVFCDFENVALGVRDARYDAFDIQLVLARVLDKGKVVVKKAYADWDRYKAAKRPMHEAAFELIEIPHARISGKNSADIRMVVDALDLSYTKTHVDGFVLITGDSDFSPLVSKLRENDKMVIGVGVKNSTSDLLVDNCDEFIYYDDLVRAQQGRSSRTAASRRKKGPAQAASAPAATSAAGGQASAAPAAAAATKKAEAPKDARDATKDGREGGKEVKVSSRNKPTATEALGTPEEALEIVLETVESLFADRDGNLYASMVKQVLKRKRPNFSEAYYGYRTFNQLIEDAGARGLLVIQKDERSGGYVILSFGPEA
ncbi:MAG: NYN domain-containing protein [Sandaracinaceae bacterium]|nr:NYN domain-containing protein [Sandaracinaceae bacterium]